MGPWEFPYLCTPLFHDKTAQYHLNLLNCIKAYQPLFQDSLGLSFQFNTTHPETVIMKNCTSQSIKSISVLLPVKCDRSYTLKQCFLTAVSSNAVSWK